MRRRTIVFIASFLAVLAAILPLVGIAVYSRLRAVEGEKKHLADYADRVLWRTERNLDLAKAALHRLETEKWTGCSAAHIARMSQLTLNSRSVAEIGYFIDGRLACTSGGPVRQNIPLGPAEAWLPDGYGLDLGIKPMVTRGNPMNSVLHGSYNALINPDGLVDILTDTEMTVGVAAANGRLLSISGPADPDLVRHLAHHVGAGRWKNQMYASIERRQLRGFAITDYALIDARINKELWFLIPIGLLMSALLVSLVLWSSRLRLAPQAELSIAIRRRELIVHYQPIIELSTGLCVGAEALLRWRQADGQWVSPDQFVPLAEQTGLIEPLTDLMIDRVVQDMAPILQRDRSIHIAINISAADMQSGRFLPKLWASLAAAQIPPAQIWLEATERGFMDAAAARATIERARAAGHMVAIDDFGTGYSSLSLLETLPLDALKIDKAFVSAIGMEAATSVVIPHIIDMAHGLNFMIVAEGVETQQQELYLREAGVEFAQGWRYAKALPPEAFVDYCATTNDGRISPLFQPSLNPRTQSRSVPPPHAAHRP